MLRVLIKCRSQKFVIEVLESLLNDSPPGASLVAQMVMHLPAMQETQVRSRGWDDPLEKEMTTHSSILAWKIPMDRGAWWATVHGVAKSQTRLSDKEHTHTC